MYIFVRISIPPLQRNMYVYTNLIKQSVVMVPSIIDHKGLLMTAIQAELNY